MLSEERCSKILTILDKKKAVTVIELVNLLNTSESTIRRDLNALDKQGKLNKVFGGATSLDIDRQLIVEEKDIKDKYHLNKSDKIKIASYAASLIAKNDFIYIDAGTTTEYMVDFITEKDATYVTNGINQAKKLAKKGLTVFILGGKLKISTEAIIGAQAINDLRKFNFTKGFFGANGVSEKEGLTTPDINEAIVKEAALNCSHKAYILADCSKFGKVFPVTFAECTKASVITTKLKDKKYLEFLDLLEVD